MVTQQKSNLFRKEALERASSPERLDQLIQVVSPKRWLSLAALGSLVVAGLGWSIMGRIPITVTGQGVLIFPHKVVSFQSPSSGPLRAINVHVGDVVKKGQVLATIDQSDLQKQLQLARDKLTQLQIEDQNVNLVQMQRGKLDKGAIALQRQALLQSLQATQTLTPVLREKGLESIQRDRQNLQQRLQSMQELQPTFKKRYELRQKLFEQGALSDDTVLQARQDYLNGIAQIDEAESELKQLDLKEADAQQQYLQNLNSIQQLQAQLKQLDTQAATQAQQDLEATTNREKEIQDTQRTIAQLQEQLKNNTQIVSDYNGRVLEIAATPGQEIGPGTPIGSIAAEDSSAQLVNVAFFPVSEGKKIRQGMQVEITPSSVKREEFGGIVGAVTNVSAFPITKEGAASLVGNSDIVQGITSAGPQLEVFAGLKLEPSTYSGFRWSSSQGPQLHITPGTTTSVRVTVDERAPISFVLPILKSWSGLD
ncbi:HlyD family secretion protein (plasmid) [Scytonema sp. HK-05]|uniref:NHLP bacteriocin system secretion protein n=1 Tax=Scytonema sp. HK-05 TaxID=1137095 RepID=UPI00093736A7|nr:NHLP bacteriocin system secretion protein [Scytonema sp. HK-05]OKH57082.1 NHLP bacteriocin system secretion protein [Scytonema sp. HK-05]BAY50286.1 HlyD family secretion protein [Scytonema sp. HK-05]